MRTVFCARLVPGRDGSAGNTGFRERQLGTKLIFPSFAHISVCNFCDILRFENCAGKMVWS
jgi:hypothetical protein